MGSSELDVNVLQLVVEIRKTNILHIIENILKNDGYQKSSLGFTYIEYMFNYSEITLNFLAKHFISKIFLELDLEKHLHENYENFEDFHNKNEQRVFVINYISSKDTTLAHYVINHPAILREIMYAFDYIQKAWNHYINKESNNIYELIFNQISEYIKLFKNKDSDTIQNLWNTAYYTSYTSEILEPFFN